jgi:hypothetical protein
MLFTFDFAQKLFSRNAHQPRFGFFVSVTIRRFLEQRHVPYSHQKAHRLLKIRQRVKQKLMARGAGK